MSTRTAERLGARVEVLDGVGHWWALQEPVEAASILTRFVASIG